LAAARENLWQLIVQVRAVFRRSCWMVFLFFDAPSLPSLETIRDTIAQVDHRERSAVGRREIGEQS